MKLELFAREILFKLYCTHRQGEKKNIFLFANRRSGSTWILNTIAQEKGMRYMGRPLQAMNHGRHKSLLPPSAKKDPIIFLEENDLKVFKKSMTKLANAEIDPYPYLNFRTSWFKRMTSRVVYQMTAAIPMIEWFTKEIPATSIWLHRHPIPNALSIQNLKWPHRLQSFLDCSAFIDVFLNGHQVDLIKNIINESGSKNNLAAHTLECCLWSLGPIQSLIAGSNQWRPFSYESFTTNLEPTLNELIKTCELENHASILAQAKKPSRNISTESKARGKVTGDEWKSKIHSGDLKKLNLIIKNFTGEFFIDEA